MPSSSTAKLRRDAVRIFDAAVRAVQPAQTITRHLKLDGNKLVAGGGRYDLDRFERAIVLGAGKASSQMAAAVEKLLGKRIHSGLISTKYGHTAKLKRIEQRECAHPVPDQAGLDAANRMLELAEGAGARDLVLCLVSGGASALLPCPAQPVTLEAKQATTKLLLKSGATIHEINCVRKHLSRIKGGQLARAAYPATVVSLLLSDVVGDDLDVIGSGLTVGDRSTFGDALAVLDKYGLRHEVPREVRDRLESGSRGEVEETPKPGEAALSKVRNVIVGGNRQALVEARKQAVSLGYRTLILSSSMEGETRDVAAMHVAIAREVKAHGDPLRTPACLLSGGETTVTLQGEGKGGRNQEFALAAGLLLDGTEDVVLLSAGTDGTDGPTDAAGALADGGLVQRARAKGIDAKDSLSRNDSYPLLEATGDLVKTGPTGTNVMDVRVVLVGARKK
jgi:glycerate 2-kinase